MPRVSIDISGAGAHTVLVSNPMDRILLREVYITFAHDEPKSLRAWFYFDTTLIAGPFYFTDGGEVRYQKTTSPNTYQAEMGADFIIKLDPELSAAGFVDYEVASW